MNLLQNSKQSHALFFSLLMQGQPKQTTVPLYDLEEFRQTVPQSEREQTPYTINKKKVFTYRMLFLLLSAFFMALTCFIYERLPSTLSYILMGDVIGLRYPLMSLTVTFSFIAGYIGFTMQTENEVLHHIFHRAKKRLKECWNHSRASAGFLSRLPFGIGHNGWYKQYRTLEDKIDHLRKEQESLLKCIREAPHVSYTQREKLFNQALREFELKTHHITEQLSA